MPTIKNAGAKPDGTSDEQSAASAVQAMFNSIAPRYDLLNHVLSLNVDRYWWMRTAHRYRKILKRPEATVLDLCCGTGDMTLALERYRPKDGRPIFAADFAHQMLVRGKKKFAKRAVVAIEADALMLPFADGSLDLVTTAFGFRNLANYRSGLEEFYRVLKPGGELAILDFSEPPGLIGKLYAFYFRRVLPTIGRIVCGDEGPYAYLPASVERFPQPPEMLSLMAGVGYENSQWTPYTFGIAGLYSAQKR